MWARGRCGKGVDFFTGVEPGQAQIQVFARGNYSPAGLRDIMLSVQERIYGVGYFKGIVMQSGTGQQLGGDQQTAPDLIGYIFVEMTDRRDRELNGFEVENRYREAIANLPGPRAAGGSIEPGPPGGQQLQKELSGDDPQAPTGPYSTLDAPTTV